MDNFLAGIFNSIRRMPYRRGPQRWVGGICGGLAAQFGWDVKVVRIVVLLSFILPYIGVATYLIAWALLPAQDGSIPLETAVRKLNA